VRELDECINLSAWLGCSVDQAFEMFIKKEHLQSWLPEITEVVPGSNGEFKVYANKTRSTKKTKKCKFVAYEQDKYLAFEWYAPKDKSKKTGSDQDITVSVYFLPIDIRGKKRSPFTEVNLSLTGWHELQRDDDNDDSLKDWFENTWTDAFENLIVHVNDVFSE
jgi:uncharacterized protein YndB with AHSA1/START domain